MYIDFKITTWDRVHILSQDEAEVRRAIENGELTSQQDFTLLDVEGSWEKVDNADEQMSVEENGGNATVEVWENNDEKIYTNAVD
jgi:hypothetical protein